MAKKNLTSRTEVDKFRFATQYNYDPQSSFNFNPSDDTIVTVPDDSLTILEILHRFSTGGWTPPHKSTAFTGSEGDDFDDWDPTEDPGFDLADASDYEARLHRSYQSHLASIEDTPDTPKTPEAESTPPSTPNPESKSVENSGLDK